MSRPLSQTALHAAISAGTPFVHVRGNEIALIMVAQVDPLTGQAHGNGDVRICSSSGLARAAAARVLTDLRSFPFHGVRILDVSIAYAEAALRHARRRAGTGVRS